MKKLISWLLIIFNIHIINKKDKIEILQILVMGYKLNNCYSGICIKLNKLTGQKYNIIQNLYLYFPEIYIQKPKLLYSSNLWFDFTQEGINKRIEILEKAIKRLNK